MAKKPDGTKNQKPKTSKQVVVKVKGPVPASYAPKVRMNGEYVHNTNRQLRESAPYWRELVAGIEGDYFIGIRGEEPQAESFELRMVEGRNGQYLVIYGEEGTFIPYAWLFIRTDKCNFIAGPHGTTQRRMLELLKTALDTEIKLAKDARRAAVQKAVEPIIPQQKLSWYTDGDNQSDNRPMSAPRRIDKFDRSKSVLLTKQVLNARLKNDGVGGLCHIGGNNEMKIYFLRERIAGAQKITFLEGGADELLTAIEDHHLDGVTVDVKSVVDGLHSAVTSVDLKDVRNARIHVTNWLCHHFGFIKQDSTDQVLDSKSASA